MLITNKQLNKVEIKKQTNTIVKENRVYENQCGMIFDRYDKLKKWRSWVITYPLDVVHENGPRPFVEQQTCP